MHCKTWACRAVAAILVAGNAGALATDGIRIDPDLGRRRPVSPGTLELAGQGRIAVHVYTEPGAEIRLGGSRTDVLCAHQLGDVDLRVLATTIDQARRMASLPGVLWVEQAPEPTPRNDTVRLIVQSGSTSSGPFDTLGLDGSGQIVGVIDQPLDWDHCAFDDPANPIGPAHRKIEAYNAPFAGVSAHGTHVCGTLAGDSTQSGNLRGVAPGARIAFNTIPAFDETPLRQRLDLHASQGAAIHSNSWGDDQSSVYGGLARAVDSFCWENDEQLVIFAVSNGSSLKTPENAKNALAVAATQDSPMQHRFCVGAGGPTIDGRRKPDLVAPGCSVFSAYPFGAGCPTVFNSGTSMATPAVAGAAAIVRQYFMDGHHPDGPFTPSGALLKAVLIAGAADLTDEPGWPSSREGWGRVLLAGSLPVPGGGRSLLVEQAFNNTPSALVTGQWAEVLFEVIDPGEPMRVVLSWHDAPGDFGSADPVVNDLDLSIETPGGLVYLGNRIDSLTGESIPGGTPDSINNVEVIALSFAEPGVYAARIDGASVEVGAQGFGLAVVGAVAAIAEPCGVADLAEPTGVLDLADVTAFASGFAAQEAEADMNGDGMFDLGDINEFVSSFLAGCP